MWFVIDKIWLKSTSVILEAFLFLSMCITMESNVIGNLINLRFIVCKVCLCPYFISGFLQKGRHSTYKTVYVQRAFASRCTLYVTAVPGARPKTAAVTLWSAHRLSH